MVISNTSAEETSIHAVSPLFKEDSCAIAGKAKRRKNAESKNFMSPTNNYLHIIIKG